jgi:hypothetical protein
MFAPYNQLFFYCSSIFLLSYQIFFDYPSVGSGGDEWNQTEDKDNFLKSCIQPKCFWYNERMGTKTERLFICCNGMAYFKSKLKIGVEAGFCNNKLGASGCQIRRFIYY